VFFQRVVEKSNADDTPILKYIEHHLATGSCFSMTMVDLDYPSSVTWRHCYTSHLGEGGSNGPWFLVMKNTC